MNTKRLLLNGLLCLVFNSFIQNKSQACGPDDPSYHYFNLFVPEWLFDREYSPVFYTTQDYWHIWASPDYGDENLSDWQQYFKQQVNSDALKRVLAGDYADPYGSMERADVLKNVLFKNSKLPAIQVEAAKKYLALALDIEKLSNPVSDWWYYENPDTLSDADKAQLLDRIARAYDMEKDPFLKDRYAFQLIKSYRYAGQPDRALALFQTHFENNKNKPFIYWWALDHVAGMELDQGEAAEGYYHFLQVFQYSQSRRHSAYYSFDIRNQDTWNAVYRMAASPQEKALMHFLRGSKEKVLGLQDAEQILALLGNHEWLKLLIAREINKLESENLEYFGALPVDELFNNLKSGQPILKNTAHTRYASQLLQFANTMYYNNRKDGFWTAAKTYLEFLNGRMDLAKATIQENSNLSDPYLKITREVRLAIQIVEKEGPFSREEEDAVAREIVEIFEDQEAQFFTDQNNEEFILDLLAYKARQLNDPLMHSFYARDIFWGLKVNPTTSKVDSLLDFVRKETHSDLELLALKHYMENSQDWQDFHKDLPASLNSIEAKLLDMKGRLLMRNPDKLEAALAIFESLPDTFDYAIEMNPFNMSIRDCIHPEDCNRKTNSIYTRNSLVRKLIEMKGLAQQNNSSTDYYLLGNAYYNMTYFGPAWEVANYWRSSAEYSGFYDCEPALQFYEKAIQYATDKEQAAKACFMAAKAEQNLYFVQKASEPDENSWYWNYYSIDGYDWESYVAYQREIEMAGYRKHFARLKREFSTTKYYQKAIQECKYFEYYVSR